MPAPRAGSSSVSRAAASSLVTFGNVLDNSGAARTLDSTSAFARCRISCRDIDKHHAEAMEQQVGDHAAADIARSHDADRFERHLRRSFAAWRCSVVAARGERRRPERCRPAPSQRPTLNLAASSDTVGHSNR